MSKAAIQFLLAFIAASLFALDSTLMKVSNVQNPVLIGGFRMFATLVFLCIVFRKIPKFKNDRLFIGATCSSFLASLLLITSLQMIPVAIAIMLFFSSIIWLCLWKWLAKNKVDRVDVVTSIFVFIGLNALLYQPTVQNNYLGFFIALSAGAFFAGFLYFSSACELAYPDEDIFFNTFGCALVSLICIFVVYVCIVSVPLPSSTQITILLSDGLLYGLAWYLLMNAFNLARQTGSVILVNTFVGAFEPLSSVFLAYYILGEEIGPNAYLGLVIIIVTISLRGLFLNRSETSAE